MSTRLPTRRATRDLRTCRADADGLEPRPAPELLRKEIAEGRLIDPRQLGQVAVAVPVITAVDIDRLWPDMGRFEGNWVRLVRPPLASRDLFVEARIATAADPASLKRGPHDRLDRHSKLCFESPRCRQGQCVEGHQAVEVILGKQQGGREGESLGFGLTMMPVGPFPA